MPEAESRGAATGVELAGFCFALSDCAIATRHAGQHRNQNLFVHLFSFSKSILRERLSV
jgi:hypothetical protein